MGTSAKTPVRGVSRAARFPHAERRRIALTAMVALASASLLVLLNDFEVGPAWVHWLGSLVAVAAALGVVAIAQLTWERAINAAKSAGLVESNPLH
ncbi:MAG: hypothetical protein ABW137_15170 [Mycobacterium sp.]